MEQLFKTPSTFKTTNKQLGLPYMGSKRKLAKPILDFIFTKNPNCKYFYDLFGGGGAMSFEALQRPYIKEVHYNEINTAIVSLLKDIRDNGVTDKYFNWISREDFFKYKDGDDWFAGLCQVVWSFGNNGKDYLYSKKIEADKKLLHKIIVDKNLDSLYEFKSKFNLDLSDCLNFNDLHDRRKKTSKIIKKNHNDFQRLQNLEQLQSFQSLQRLQNLKITNSSYQDVKINTPIEETIIYLDPPYKNTAKYKNVIDFEELEKWVLNSPYKIYISGYEWDLPCVWQKEHRSTLSSTNNSKVVTEKLFCNNA